MNKMRFGSCRIVWLISNCLQFKKLYGLVSDRTPLAIAHAMQTNAPNPRHKNRLWRIWWALQPVVVGVVPSQILQWNSHLISQWLDRGRCLPGIPCLHWHSEKSVGSAARFFGLCSAPMMSSPSPQLAPKYKNFGWHGCYVP